MLLQPHMKPVSCQCACNMYQSMCDGTTIQTSGGTCLGGCSTLLTIRKSCQHVPGTNARHKTLNQHGAVQLALEALESGLSPQAASMVSELVASQQGRPPPGRRRAFVPSPAQLKALPLQYGQNTIDFTFAGQRLRAYIHYFNWNSRYISKAPHTINHAKTSITAQFFCVTDMFNMTALPHESLTLTRPLHLSATLHLPHLHFFLSRSSIC